MRDLFEAICRYAVAYNEVERFQPKVYKEKHGKNAKAPLASGDQKTGVFAEFYAKLFAQSEYPSAEVEYAGHSTKGYDLVVQTDGTVVHRIQVKAVSGHSATSRISPIHDGWTLLYLMRLDRVFRPIGFWVLERGAFADGELLLQHKTMPEEGQPETGSVEFKGQASSLTKLQLALDTARRGQEVPWSTERH
jgi:hypothetical protein